MYKIIGGDQKEYGPVTADELRTWIAEGRANGQSQVQLEGGPWKPLASYPEFADALAAAAPAPAPVPAAAAPLLPPSPAGSDAARAVSAPAVCLIVSTILGMLNSALGVVFNLAGVRFPMWNMPHQGQIPEVEHFLEVLGGTLGTISGLVTLAIGALILVGAFRMMKLKSHGLAVAASVLAMIPCVSPCCCLGLPFGIWALVVLLRPDVKAAFR